VARYLLALDPEGLWYRNQDNQATFAGTLAVLDPPPPEEVASETLDGLNSFIFPALMTLSFMHCTNVTEREVAPPPRLAKKWRKRHGRDLVRYHVLDIAPMGAVLHREGQAGEQGLAHALHICRGHFKTFSQDAPLFGRLAGTFWWAPHVRGDLAETWFSILTKQQVRRGVYHDVPELIAAIATFIEGYNQRAQPFIWTKTADGILTKAIKQQPTSGTLH